MKRPFCLILLLSLLLFNCTGNQKLKQDAIDLASYGVGLDASIAVSKATIKLPQLPAPIEVEGLYIYINLDVGRYDTAGDEREE